MDDSFFAEPSIVYPSRVYVSYKGRSMFMRPQTARRMARELLETARAIEKRNKQDYRARRRAAAAVANGF